MGSDRDSWATQQLVEFLASVSSYHDSESAIRGAIEAASEALETEIAAVVLEGRVEAAIGFPRGEAPEGDLIAAATQHAGTLEVDGLGRCRWAAVPIETEIAKGSLLVARFDDEQLSGEELDLLRGMGRVLAMSLESVGLLESLRERQSLLERLSRLQRSIASRAELQDVLDAIVSGATELIGDDVAGLRLIASDDPRMTDLAAFVGLEQDDIEGIRRAPVETGAAGAAIQSGRLVVIHDYPGSEAAFPELSEAGLRAAMAAPIFERKRVAGALVVSSRRPGRTYSEGEREMLTAFAEHAGLALNDARAVAETFHQAYHDSLTGLPNRANFLDRLESLLGPAGRSGGEAAVLFVDLDGFKTVNDSLGHQAGDELLVMVARRLINRVSGGCTVARFGGDEFAILLEGPKGRAAQREAERLLESFEQPFQVRGREVSISASIGISSGSEQADHLLRNADLAMYQAKSRGKGRSEAFEPGMHTAVVERLELEADLKRALDREELLLHYQPVCELTSGRVVGVEALARWQHPVRGLIQPDDFIGLAEESRQILELGRWVLREACRQAALWQARHQTEPPLEMGVNLSGVQLEHPDLVEEVRTALERANLDPGSLVLEITETALMADTEANAHKLEQLKELGVRLAVDDFGTGYSSLDYLRRFPIDVLKVAKSFVDDLRSENDEPALVRAIIDLARSFDLTVVAEGIEQPEQRHRLAELGCAHGQGYLFAYPSDAATTDSLLIHSAVLGEGPAASQPLPGEASEL